jgi:recombination protein RecT
MADNKQLTIKDYISAPQVQQKMQEMFSEKRLLDGFVQSVISLAGSDELLSTAEPRSVFNAALQAASLNLPINKNLGFAHIIGYKNNKKGITEAQFQIGAKGLKQLAQRTGQYKFLNDTDVREGELNRRDRMTGQITFDWIEDDAEREAKPIVGYLCYFELKSGFSSTLFMTVEQLEEHARQYSKAYQNDLKYNSARSPWSTDRDAMCRKTVIKLNINRNGPMSTELQRAVELDQSVVKDDGTPDYIDGEVVDAPEDKKADQRKRIEAAKAKREAMDAEDHKPKAVKTKAKAEAPAEEPTGDDPVVPVDEAELAATENGTLLDDVAVGQDGQDNEA